MFNRSPSELRRRIAATTIAAALLLAGGCAPAPPPAAEPSLGPAPEVGLADLRWLLGTWRGTGEGEEFYEEFRAVDDSTFVILYFTDETRSELQPVTGTVEQRGGRIIHTYGDLRWVAAAGSSTSLLFEPLQEATNRFSWTYDSPSRWTAVLINIDETGREVTQTYVLERLSGQPAEGRVIEVTDREARCHGEHR